MSKIVKSYVEIPYDRFGTLQFPDFCPLTARPNPDIQWEISGKTKYDRALLLPVLLATKNRQFKFSIPVHWRFVQRQNRLDRAMWLLLGLFFSLLLISICLNLPTLLVEIAVLCSPTAFVPLLIRKWLGRHVQIDYVGEDFAEIAFTNRKYAEEFSGLNGLVAKRKLINFRPD